MPICEADPWRLQYFAHVKTAANIPTEDSDAWQWYPAHRWVYDKLAVALSQNLEAAPHGVAPPRFPVFSKPIVNLKRHGRRQPRAALGRPITRRITRPAISG